MLILEYQYPRRGVEQSEEETGVSHAWCTRLAVLPYVLYLSIQRIAIITDDVRLPWLGYLTYRDPMMLSIVFSPLLTVKTQQLSTHANTYVVSPCISIRIICQGFGFPSQLYLGTFWYLPRNATYHVDYIHTTNRIHVGTHSIHQSDVNCSRLNLWTAVLYN